MDTQLYESRCPLVRRSVCWTVVTELKSWKLCIFASTVVIGLKPQQIVYYRRKKIKLLIQVNLKRELHISFYVDQLLHKIRTKVFRLYCCQYVKGACMCVYFSSARMGANRSNPCTPYYRKDSRILLQTGVMAPSFRPDSFDKRETKFPQLPSCILHRRRNKIPVCNDKRRLHRHCDIPRYDHISSISVFDVIKEFL